MILELNILAFVFPMSYTASSILRKQFAMNDNSGKYLLVLSLCYEKVFFNYATADFGVRHCNKSFCPVPYQSIAKVKQKFCERK